ncbi:Glycerol dehydrogenase [uncultured Roseburia sp.]|uniref:Iron-containing alcohol dehydrogenase n=1 Tax=Brotonthovivens ammoniilytica TaxID=2981725 RepID=A0ABT2TH95_9FIRM|nr:iron-containing alcohol dehydrogenase [Brotonthovivens ammoniilytica]MCU6761086.1 iron-containing alcohol dehydrogenase [Brotonthovivens ammoniilytica]SCI18409.1 Glycerol dehydrogenase [uncultured Roseburia sp.]
MKRLFFPGTFCVGNDILKDFVQYTSCYGNKFVFIGDEISLGVSRQQLAGSFQDRSCTCDFITSGKLACRSEISRIQSLPQVQDADVICAVGGGGCMDIARTIANTLKKALVMVPTTASSDAPCTFVALCYSEDGSEIISDAIYHKCPDMVMVDSKIIAEAPPRLLAAGMGDAMATIYEGSTNYANPKGIGITQTAMAMCRLCKDIIVKDGMAAYRAVECKSVTTQLENVIEANCFLSGIGGLNSGCAAAHGIGDYLCKLPGGHGFLHGERVYIGLMIQMVLEQYPVEEIIKLMQFGRAAGLPVCIGDMGVENIKETAEFLAQGLQGDHFMVNLNCDYSEYILAGSIVYAQHLADHLADN